MSYFEDKLEEAMSFGTGSYMELDDLRRLYYGRRDIYVSFTDDGEYVVRASDNELDRPNSIVCYKVNDVVGRKVSTSEFYASVFRINKSRGNFIDNINYYSKEDLDLDINILRSEYRDHIDSLNSITDQIFGSRTNRSPFETLWTITEFFSKEVFGDRYGAEWRNMLMFLGYSGFHDPNSTGVFTGDRVPVTVYLDYGSRNDLDILPIQKFRMDPRARVRKKVARMVSRYGVRRDRVSKSNRGGSGGKGNSFSQTLAAFQELL